MGNGENAGEVFLAAQSREVGVGGDLHLVREAEPHGFLKFLERLARLSLAGQRAGEVVAPGGILRKDFDGLRGDFEHGLVVLGRQRLLELRNELLVDGMQRRHREESIWWELLLLGAERNS